MFKHKRKNHQYVQAWKKLKKMLYQKLQEDAITIIDVKQDNYKMLHGGTK